MTIVFQYGSNCLESEINGDRRLRGDAKFVGIAQTVEDFALTFDVWSGNRKCAASDIARMPGSKVWGVLYEVPDDLIDRETAKARGRKSFDEIEGEGANYKREMIDVRRPDGEVVNALTYTVRNPDPGLKTSKEYVGFIVAGLREHDVSEDYIAQVKAIAVANNPEISAAVEKL
jgi:cation transport regulator ChaC